MLSARDVGVVILAGGAAERFPGKLTQPLGGVPLIVHVYRNVSPGRETVVSAKGMFGAEIDAQLPMIVIDRWEQCSPLNGLLSAMEEVSHPFVFAVAADMPNVTAAFIDILAGQHQPGEEALVPCHDGGVEPLAALYDRLAFVREGIPVLHSQRPSLQAVIARLAHRFVRVDDARIFTNVNTASEYDQALKEWREGDAFS